MFEVFFGNVFKGIFANHRLTVSCPVNSLYSKIRTYLIRDCKRVVFVFWTNENLETRQNIQPFKRIQLMNETSVPAGRPVRCNMHGVMFQN